MVNKLLKDNSSNLILFVQERVGMVGFFIRVKLFYKQGKQRRKVLIVNQEGMFELYFWF